MLSTSDRIVVCGGGGFIGGHLIGDLLAKGHKHVRCVDVKPTTEWYQVHPQAENIVADLNLRDKAAAAVKDCDVVYNLACNMGGMGFIELNKGLCMISVLINTHLLLGAREHGVKRFFYASSACVYNGEKQKEKKLETFLKEEDAYPAMPEDGYGWEKLFSERMCRHFREDFKVPTRVARFHNVEDIGGIKLNRKYNLAAPKGVNGRNSDNTLIKKVFEWEPDTRLRDGMEKTYRWIYDQMTSK